MRQFFRAVGNVAFCAFLIFDLFLTFSTPLRYIVLFPSLVSATFYIVSIKLKSVDYVSAAWLILGSLSVLSYFAIETFETSLGLVLLVVAILFFHDFERHTHKVELALDPIEERKLFSGYASRTATTLALTLLISLPIVALSPRIISVQVTLYYSVALVSFLILLSFFGIRAYSSNSHASSE